jgi:hydrogenase maturation protease HycI
MPLTKRNQTRKIGNFRSGKTESDWRRTIRKELGKAERLVVLGIGNAQRGDDAAGTLFIRRLEGELARRRPRSSGSAPGADAARPGLKKPSLLELRVLDAGAAPENVTGLIRGFRPTHVLIIDAAAGNHRPGTIFVMDKEKIRDEDISTHRLPLFHLVRYLEEGIGCRVILIGIEPKTTAWGTVVSPEVKAAAMQFAGWLRQILSAKRA